jgi:hypothetical protein
MLYLRLVLHHDIVVLAEVDFRPLSHGFQLGAAPPLLYTDVFVHLRLENAELVHLSFGCHAESAVTACAIRETRPEIGELIDNRGIVAYGFFEMTELVVKQGSVENSHEVLRLHLDDEVEVCDSAVVIAELYAKQSAVIMCQEVVGVEVDSHVIVFHGSSQVVDVDSCQSPVHIVVGHLWRQV